MKDILKLFINTCSTFAKENKTQKSFKIPETLKRFFEAGLMVLILLDILLLTIVTFVPVKSDIYTGVVYFDLVVVLILIPDFINRLRKSEDKMEFLKYNWTDVIGMIPVIIIPQAGSLFSYFRLIRILALFKKNIAHAFEFLHKTRIDYGVTIILAILFSASIAMFLVEHSVNSHMHRLSDALWCTLVTITTVGYGDVTPVTPAGKVISAFIMFTGIGFMGFVTAAITSRFVSDSEKEEEIGIHEKLDKLQAEMDELKELIRDKK
ncbi:Ion channel [anaerobic digester metagenome]